MLPKNSFFPEAGKAPQTSQARPAPRTGEVAERQRWPEGLFRHPPTGVFFALFHLFPARFPRTHQTAQAEQADADAGQQVGQGQHAAGGFKQGLGQLQPGAEQERARPRRVERMPAGQTRHKKNFDQHHSQQQCGGSTQHPQRAGHTAERRGRKLEPPDEPPQKHQRHSARQQRAAQPLALQAEAAERPHGVVQQPRTGKDRQQQVRPRGPDRAAPGEYLKRPRQCNFCCKHDKQ